MRPGRLQFLMNSGILSFLDRQPEMLPVYETLEKRILEEIPETRVKVQKSQISFYNRHMFACISFLRLRKKADCPEQYMVVSFGLRRREMSERIEAAVEPYPGRWTHHLVVCTEKEIDEELMGWLKEAAACSAR